MFFRSVSAAICCLFSCGMLIAAENEEETYFYTDDGSARLFVIQDEQTAVLSENNVSSLVRSADSSFLRNEYDDLMRLKSRTQWRVPDSTAPAEIAVRIEYSYDGDSTRLLKSETYEPARSAVTVTTFSNRGLPLSERVYSLSAANSADSGTPDLKPTVPRFVSGSAEKNGILQRTTEYVYTDDSKLQEKTLTDYSVKKPVVYRTVYQSAGDIRGGFDYFENGTLRISRKYVDADSYTEIVYFDGGQRIETVYDDGKLREEIFFSGTAEIRRNMF